MIVPSRPRPYDRVHLAVRTDDWKAILRAPGWITGTDHRWVEQSRELYDLRSDPRELQNLATTREVDIWAAMAMAVERQAPAPVHDVLPPEQLEMLRTLGYAR